MDKFSFVPFLVKILTGGLSDATEPEPLSIKLEALVVDHTWYYRAIKKWGVLIVILHWVVVAITILCMRSEKG